MTRFFSPTADSASSLPRFQFAIALLLTALSVALHGGFWLQHPALWRDEVNSVGLATMPTLRELWLSLSYDSSPVLWPLLLRGWILLAGDSDFSLRSAGFLVQMLLIGGLWFSSLSIGKRAPVVSLFLIGCQPAVVVWPSLRSYGLGAALMVWTAGCLWRAVRNPRSKWRAATLILALLSVQCVYVNVLLLGVLCAGGGAISWRRGERKTVVFPVLLWFISAASVLIYIPTLRRIAPWQITTVQAVSLHAVLSSFLATLRAAGDFMPSIWIGLFVFLLPGALVVLLVNWNGARHQGAAVEAENRSNQTLIYGAIVSVFSFAVMVLFLMRAGRATYPWHFVGLMALLAASLDVLAAGVLTADVLMVGVLKNARVQLVFLILAAALGVANFPLEQRDVAVKRTNVDVLSAQIERLAAPSDLVVITPFGYGVTFQRYYHGPTTWATVPDIREYRVQRYDILKHLMETPNSLARVETLIRQTLKSGHRVWLMGRFPASPALAPRYVSPLAFHVDGWFAPRYESYCAARIAYFLAAHRARRAPVAVRLEGEFNSLELGSLERVEGWNEREKEAIR